MNSHVHKFGKAHALVSLGDFSCPTICWIIGLGAAEENFLRQVNAELSTGDVLLNLLLKNKEKPVKDIKGTAILPCRNHRTGALNPVRQSQKKITSLDFRKANFGLLRDLLGSLMEGCPGESEGHKTAAWHSETASSEHRHGVFGKYLESRASVEGGQHG